MTTLGTTLAATCSTLPIGAFEAGIPGAAPPGSAPSATEASDPWCAITDAAAPPIPADTTATATAPTVNAPARERFRGAGAGGRPSLTTGEVAVGLSVLPLLGLLAVTPVVALLIGLLLPWAGMACGPALIGHGTISVLLRRWRIPRVIRHVARSLSLVQSVQTQTVTGFTLPGWSEIRLR